MKKEHIEAMSEILSESGISATAEQIKQIAQGFFNHLEVDREMEGHSHVLYNPECKQCESLKAQLKDMTSQRDIYQNSVKKRRNADNVWLEGDIVKYE